MPSSSPRLQVACAERAIFLNEDDEFAREFRAAIDATASGREILFCDYAAVEDGVDQCAATLHAPHAISLGAGDPDSVHVMNFIPNSCLVYPWQAVEGRCFDESLVLNEDWAFLLDVLRGWRLRDVPVIGPTIHKTACA